MNHTNSIGISFFGLSVKDLAVFDRVIAFVEKKGEKFHKCTAEMAQMLIVNDDDESITSARKQKKSQILITVTDKDDCTVGDYTIKRPLLITRVMRAMSESRKQCKTADSINIQIPPASADRSNVKANGSSPSNNTNKKEGSFHALVVDDSMAIRKQLEIELRETSISADYAACGEEALKKIEGRQYDLVFLDIIMPDINGYEVCKKLRKKKNYKKTPVIMLSGKTSPLDEVEGILAGASTYLLKPVKHNDFQNTLRRISKWLTYYT